MKALLTLSFALFIGFQSFAQDVQAPVEVVQSDASGLTWYTDMMEARKISEATGKPIFAFFTGSDWCIWCKRMQANVFSKADFVKWANENVVLVELDFPRQKQLPEALAQQNVSLKNALRPAGYPTVFMIYLDENPEVQGNFTIRNLGSLGYPADGEPGKEEQKFIEKANLILSNK